MLVKYGATPIEFTIVRTKGLKNTYIHVGKNGVVVKTNKTTTDNEIRAYVVQKARWIEKNLQGYRSRLDTEIVAGSRLYYFGKSYYVNLAECDTRGVRVEFIRSKFKIQVPPNCGQSQIYEGVDAFYKDKAIQKIMPLVQKWGKLMEAQPTHVSFRKAEHRWGSCSHTNRISFNYHLMKLHRSLIEYVVVHELCHIKHKNHSQEFWSEVRRYLPDYKSREAQIKVFEKLF